MAARQHEQHQEPENEAAKWNLIIFHLSHCVSPFPAVDRNRSHQISIMSVAGDYFHIFISWWSPGCGLLSWGPLVWQDRHMQCFIDFIHPKSEKQKEGVLCAFITENNYNIFHCFLSSCSEFILLVSCWLANNYGQFSVTSTALASLCLMKWITPVLMWLKGFLGLLEAHFEIHCSAAMKR